MLVIRYLLLRLFGNRLARSDGGNVLIITGLAMPVLCGMAGLAIEGANWYQTRHAMQNAADTAAVAAATNGTSSYLDEARAVTATYGFTNGSDDTTVTASNAATCPSGGSTCYSVTISRNVPLLLAQIIGFTGNATSNGHSAVQVSTTAVAEQGSAPRNYCLVALAHSMTEDAVAFTSNGAPKADLSGCDIISNASMTCHGSDLLANYADAAGTNTGCGTIRTSNVTKMDDPYESLSSNIPSDTCPSYPSTPTTTNGNLIAAGSYSWTGNKIFCGNVKLNGNVTLTGDDVTIVIENGSLNLNGSTLKTASGAGATIVFTGSNSSSYSHIPTGSGTINIAAPTTGDWSGVAMYQDPNLTTNVNISYSGNSPAWDITGLVYLPHSQTTFSGIVNKAGNGAECFVMVVDTLTINGTGKIADQGDCKDAGLDMPPSTLPTRGKLVA